MFNIDFDKIIELLLPIALRRPRLKAYLKAVSKPLKQLYNTFTAYRLHVLQSITHTGQVMYIEHLLNDLYDPLSRNIYLDDSTDARLDDYLFNAAEGQDVMYLFNDSEEEEAEYVYNSSEYDAINDFIVKVPSHLYAHILSIKATIDNYRQAGKRYSIEYFDINT